MFGQKTKQNPDLGKTTNLNIAHVELLVPRGLDEFDVLGLGYGLSVRDGVVYEKEDQGGKIINYNYDNSIEPVPAADTDISHRPDFIDPLVKISEDGEVVPTAEGKIVGLQAMDWQIGGDEYLAALNLPGINFDKLMGKTSCFLTALEDDLASDS